MLIRLLLSVVELKKKKKKKNVTADSRSSKSPHRPRCREPAATSLLVLLLPVLMSVGTLAATVAVFVAGSPVARNPGFLAFPATMVVSMVVTALTGRGRRRGAAIDADRDEYLAYLSGLRDTVIETATAQYVSLIRAHPEPDTLWTLVGGPLMWGRQPGGSGLRSSPRRRRKSAACNPIGGRPDPSRATMRSGHHHRAAPIPAHALRRRGADRDCAERSADGDDRR